MLKRILIFTAGILTAMTPTSYTLKSKGLTGQLLSPGEWLGQELKFEPYNELRQQLEKKLGRSLKSRGEAHVTLITPPEMKILREKISHQSILDLAKTHKAATADFEVLCLGKAQKEKLSTYYVVVRSPAWLNLRKALEKKFADSDRFQASKFYPHITLGFTERDLHFEDGARKDEKSCIAKVKVP